MFYTGYEKENERKNKKIRDRTTRGRGVGNKQEEEKKIIDRTMRHEKRKKRSNKNIKDRTRTWDIDQERERSNIKSGWRISEQLSEKNRRKKIWDIWKEEERSIKNIKDEK